MATSQETRKLRRLLPRFSISFVLWGMTCYGLGIATQWWLEGRRSPHEELRVTALQKIVSKQDEYIKTMWSKTGGKDLRRLHLELMLGHKLLETVESQMALDSNAKTPRGMNYNE